MPNWIYFVLTANLIWSFTSLIDKIVISKGHIKNPLVYILTNGLMNVLLILFLPFVSFKSLNFMDFLIALFSGAAFVAALAFYYKAVEHDEISKVIILFQLGPIFVLALSYIFLGEILTKNNFIGFLLLLTAGLLVSYKRIKNSFKLSKAFSLMLISTFFSAIALVTSKHIFNVTSFWSAFLWLRLVEFIAVGVLLVPSIRKEAVDTYKSMTPKIKILIIFKMVINFSAFVFSGYAINNGLISLVTALGSSALPLFVFFLAMITSIYFPNIVKEEIDKKTILTKVLAIILIIIGIVLVS